MSDNEFLELYTETRDNIDKLQDIEIMGLNVWSVDHNGYGDVLAVESVRKFGSITRHGSVVNTPSKGMFLKIRGNCWVRTDLGASKVVLNDMDIIKKLLNDRDRVATLLHSDE